MTTITVSPPTSVEVLAPSPADVLAASWLLGFSSANTRKAYRRDLDAFLGWLDGDDVLAVRRSHVDGYARWCDEVAGLAASTVARRLASLSSFFDYCADEGAISRNPVGKVRRPKVAQDSSTLGLTKDQCADLLTVATDDRDAVVVGLLMLLGLRASEVCALDVADLGSEQAHRIVKVSGKGGTVTRMPLPPTLAAKVEEHVGDRHDGPLVLDNEGGRLDRHKVTRIVNRLARAAGIDAKVTPHVLRHSFVTQALAAGVPLHRVQDGARHADPRTTRRYDRQAKALDGHAAYSLAAFLG